MTINYQNLNYTNLYEAARISRGICLDVLKLSKSGHIGLPLGCAEIGAFLFGAGLIYNTDNPLWINRDRFVLSAGHGSLFLYSWLYLSGYNITLNDLKNFRQINSKTPGHPEFNPNIGIESTTGPLGQGIGNAVGMAISSKRAIEKLNNTIINNNIICLFGDGCVQEGVSLESFSLASHLGLDNLIFIYDYNNVTLDGYLPQAQNENTKLKFQSMGYDVFEINGHNIEELSLVYTQCKNLKNSKPKLIIAKTIIGKGIKELEGNYKAHGEFGLKYIDKAKKELGFNDNSFYVSDNIKNFFNDHKKNLTKIYTKWVNNFTQWKLNNKNKVLFLNKDIVNYQNMVQEIPSFDENEHIATRNAGKIILNYIHLNNNTIIGGAADLSSSTKTYLDNASNLTKNNFKGSNIFFGVREHAMAAISNGISFYGLFHPFCSTFLVFSDYMRPAIRLSALSNISVIYIFTHDSIGVGEDGPTHQPVETMSSLRLIPNLDVIRPADAEETVGAFLKAYSNINNPTALILSRQNLPIIKNINFLTKRNGVFKGAYIVKKETKLLDLIIISTGSEVSLVIESVNELDLNISSAIRIVSMPSFEVFDKQNKQYQEHILPSECDKRISVEAGVTSLWHKYVGNKGIMIGVNQFGKSGPIKSVFNEFGISKQNIIENIKKYIKI